MKFLLLPLLEGLLWLLRLLPKKPQPSQVRDTQADEDEIWELMQPVETPSIPRPAPQERFTDISRVRETVKRLEAESTYSPAQEWKHIAVPRHKRDLDLVNYLKRMGKI